MTIIVLTVKHNLEKVSVSKVVNSRSPEVKDLDFSLCDTYAVGDIQFPL